MAALLFLWRHLTKRQISDILNGREHLKQLRPSPFWAILRRLAVSQSRSERSCPVSAEAAYTFPNRLGGTISGESMFEGGVKLMYAIIKTGGKQYKVSEGDTISLEKLETAAGETVVFDQVLACSDDSRVRIGRPLLEGANVKAKVLEHGKDKKILDFKYKAKSNYRRRQGHRQPFTKVEIEKIEA
jgi:large subunit ribosomal protein L21